MLVAVDELVLEHLVRAATTDAAPDDVTPPLTDGTDWTATRVKWLQDFHRDRRDGLAGPAGEATWGVVAAEQVVGSVRLKRTDEQGGGGRRLADADVPTLAVGRARAGVADRDTAGSSLPAVAQSADRFGMADQEARRRQSRAGLGTSCPVR